MCCVFGRSLMFNFNSKLNHSKSLILKCRYTHLFRANYESIRSYVTWPSITVVTNNAENSITLLRRVCAADVFHGRHDGLVVHRPLSTNVPSSDQETEYFQRLYDNNLREITRLRVKLEQAQSKLSIHSVRCRIEDLEKNLLWPSDFPKLNSRRARFEKILFSEDEAFTKSPNVLAFRRLVQKSGIAGYIFVSTLVDIYRLSSNIEAYNVPLPRPITTDDIESLLNELGFNIDPIKIKTIVVIESPLIISENENCTSSSVTSV